MQIFEMQDFQQRVVEERDQLAERLTKLSAFINDNPTFTTLPEAAQDLLVDQEAVMQDYLDILEMRIAGFVEPEPDEELEA
jgi:hypothetical protein